MTGPLRYLMKLRWLMAVLTLSLWSGAARAEPPSEERELKEKESLEKWRRKAARRVLAVYEGQSLAVDRDGAVWVWGLGSGQMVGTLPEVEVASATPIRMPGMEGVVSVAVASDMMTSPGLALMKDGTVQAWGQDNYMGQLGDGTTLARQTRVTVQGLDQVVAIVTSGYSMAVRADGTLWGWGPNGCGNLGDGTQENRPAPVQVPGLTQVVAAAVGWGHSLALRADGTVWAWGCGFSGQLGNGTMDGSLHPIQVPGLTDIVAIEARTDTSYALRADGTVWAWGDVSEGQDGREPEIYARLTPVQVPGLSKVESLAAGYSHALAVRNDGTVWGWGSSRSGVLGDDGQGLSGPVRQIPGLHGVAAVAAGLTFSMALKHDGSLWTWGYNPGGMGTGSDRRLTPAPVALTGVRSLSANTFHMMALRTDGTVWSWGTSLDWVERVRATPVRVPGVDSVEEISSGVGHAMARRTDGSVWTWGTNLRGQLGDGTTKTRMTPAPVGGFTDVLGVAAGANHSLALRADGTVWAWGANPYGQLGDRTLQNRSSPVQVQGLEGAVAVFAGGDLSVALRGDGSVWWWGSTWRAWRRGDKQPHAPEPVQGLTDIVKLLVLTETVFAVRADGTLWQWTAGVPGEVNPAQQVEGFTDVVDVARSRSTLQVLRADGTVWNTGSNLHGERGFPSTELTPPGPSQVPGLAGVVSLSAAGDHIHAVRADGTVVGWGHNALGVIGDGLSPYHPTPVRVPLGAKLK